MRLLADMAAGRPDEFEVMVIKKDDCAWQTYGIYQTRLDAAEAVKRLDTNKYRKAAIKPQIKALRPFQTHVMQEVKVGE